MGGSHEMNLEHLCKDRSPYPIGPGVHLHVPRNHYDRIPALSRTAICKWITLGQIPSKYSYWMRERWNEKPTEALLMGSALDCRMLDGDFDAHYAIAPDVDRRTTAGKAQWNAFNAQHEGKTILTADQGEAVDSMAASLRAKESLEPTFKHCTKAVIVGELFGLPMKMEVDFWNPNSVHMMDLKTARDVSRKWFGKAFVEFGYDFQATFYLLFAQALGFDKKIFDFGCVENEAPWTTQVHSFAPYQNDNHWILFDANRIRLARAAKEIVRRLEANDFKDSEEWEEIEIPEWSLRLAELESLMGRL